MSLIIFQTFCLLFGGWQVGFGLATNTKDFLSAVVFKIIPMLSGIYLIVYVLAEVL